MELSEYIEFVIYHLNKKYGFDELKAHRAMKEVGFKKMATQIDNRIIFYPPVHWADAIMEIKEGYSGHISDFYERMPKWEKK